MSIFCIDMILNMKINPTTRKILTRSIFWIIYSYILYVAIIGGWWVWVAILSPILFYIFYYEDLPESLKRKKK